jgi:phosphorylcholine metabolism protein LicD
MKVILKIILFIFIFLILCYLILRNIYLKKALDLKYWRNKYSKHHNELLEHVKKVITFLEKWKVRFWAYGGTLLGCVRHGDIIPWDDDIDFGYIDDGNIQNLIKDLENNNFIFGECSFGFKIFNKDNKDIFIDMFKFTKENDMLILPA